MVKEIKNKKQVEVIIQQYKTGNYSFRDLAKRHNRSKENIRYYWVKSGLKQDKKFKKKTTEVMVQRYISKMAERWNMTPEQFKEYVKENPKLIKRLWANDYKEKSKCLKSFLGVEYVG